MQAHLVQMDVAWEDRAANHATVERMLHGTAVRPGDLVVLPELFDVGFSLNLDAAVDAQDRTLGFLLRLAVRLGVTVHGGRAVRMEGADKALNVVTVTRGGNADPHRHASRATSPAGAGEEHQKAPFVTLRVPPQETPSVGLRPPPPPSATGEDQDPLRPAAPDTSPAGAGEDGQGGGRVLCEYAKIHPFSFGREPEKYRGGGSVELYEWASGGERLSVCPAVCYDLRFPELFRIGALRGAGAFVLGANWPSARQGHWRALLIARAIENQAVVLGVNRVGNDPHLHYAGGSMAVSAKGEVFGELGDGPGVLSVRIDPDEVRAWRETFPALRDVRLRHL